MWLLEDPTRLRRFRAGDTAMLAAVYDAYARLLARAVAGGFAGLG
ncbi:MAG: hypothetical protein AAB426_07845 [Myxococcota bacterium]